MLNREITPCPNKTCVLACWQVPLPELHFSKSNLWLRSLIGAMWLAKNLLKSNLKVFSGTLAKISLYKDDHIYCKVFFIWMLSRPRSRILCWSSPWWLIVFEDIFAGDADKRRTVVQSVAHPSYTRRLYNIAHFTGCPAGHLVTCGTFIYGTFAFLMCVVEECDIFVCDKCRGTGIICTCSGNKQQRTHTQKLHTQLNYTILIQ